MLTNNIFLKNFKKEKKINKVKKYFEDLLDNQPKLFDTFKVNYKYSYSKKSILKYKRFKNIRIIGMGGSVLGSQAIYDFLKPKIKKKNNICK